MPSGRSHVPPPPASAAPSAADGPLSEQHLRELEDARRRMRSVRRAALIAALSGWTLVAFGGLTLLGVVFGSLVSLLLGGSIIALGINELRGGAELRRLEVRGARRLGWNQVILAGVIGLYAGWKLLEAATGDPLASIGGGTGDPDLDALVAGLRTSMVWAVYGSVLVVGTLVPLLTARYYFGRARVVRTVLEASPAWVVRTLRATA